MVRSNSEIPSFWSDSAFDSASLDDSEFDENDQSSDDGLFDQPETVVVQHREPTASKQVDNLREDFADQIDDESLEDSSERESSSETSESSLSSSSSPVSERSSESTEARQVQEIKDRIEESCLENPSWRIRFSCEFSNKECDRRIQRPF